MSTDRIIYFGYGSLVNRETRPLDEPAACARLRGWHRTWEHRVAASAARDPSCSLSIAPISELHGGAWSTDAAMNPGFNSGIESGIESGGDSGIDGVVVSLPLEALPILDAREDGYERLTLPATQFDLPDGLEVDEIHVYRSLSHNRLPATGEHPILQTYIDCCMAGFLRLYGEGGLDNFLTNTVGWDGAIEDDRHQPRYPRAVQVPGSLLKRFDRLVRERREGCLSLQ